MKALTYQGIMNVGITHVQDPVIQAQDDMIIRVTHSSICGSDLHFYYGMIPSMEKGFILGHETIGIVEDLGAGVHHLKKGDKVVIPYCIACGQCSFCQEGLESQCDVSNREAEVGSAFGCSRLFGDYDGGQAELLRVPFANYTSFLIPQDNEIADEELLLLTDALPTAYWSVLHAGVKPGDTVIVLGSGPIGLLTQKLAWLLGAERVIAIDHVPYRLEHAQRTNKVEAFNFKEVDDLGLLLKEETRGGADVVIDCVGMNGVFTPLELVQTALMLQGGAMGAIRMASQVVRKGGTIQLTGIYGIRYQGFPLGDLFSRNITLKMGLNPATHLIPPLYRMLREKKLVANDIITHQLGLKEAERAYDIFAHKKEGCIKVILKP
ncbi:alcohol dehydrogenase catalytic domain-containing protein [Ammoniphilus sp. CFH 90114]|uniref:alcohol dehydrogenase catalytic domain-containing protein n=1 Tax=Ammoniphilus sp. CFH 90114 TaxID=2493665 RepID=UPI00100E8CE4|nr:alcohol dehydrogenase catalytic domain-containing protein [Ammoniphilus sp. CFH 90114]RXT15471.1 glutathione-dependent formaldehyde dehydrogenase [Ammoniphilus sp. CFH 90114]